MPLTLEQQVVSLDLAQKLKAAGAPQESLFWWVYWSKWEVFYNTDVQFKRIDKLRSNKHPQEYLSAFTVAELGELLPKIWYTSYREPHGENPWICQEENPYENPEVPREFLEHKVSHFRANTEAEARGLMLFHLLENKLITL